MPRKPNYGFEKQKKEQERARKAEQKRQEKLRRKEEERASQDQGLPHGLPGETPDSGNQP